MKRLLLPLTLAALLIAPPEPAGAITASQLRAKQAQLQRQQQNLSVRLQGQRARAQALKQKEQHAVAELTTLQQKLEQTSTELQDSQYRLQRAEVKLTVTQQKLEQAKKDFGVQQRAAGSRLRAIYKNQALDGWEALLTAPDMGTFLTRYHFFKRISDHDAQLLDTLDRQAQAIHHQQRQYAQQRQTIARITEVIGSQKIQLADMTGSQQSLVKQIKTERQAAEQVVAQLEADNGQIEAMIRRMIAQRRALEQQARAHNPHYTRPPLGTGRFSMPVAGAVVTSPFGGRMHPILHRVIEHHGIDFGVGAGTPIYAPDSGEVIYAGWYGGYGKVVIIDHGGDLTTLYGHTSSYVVDAGQRIKKGQIIAYVGSTGMSTGPHLHFEVRKNGTPVNPYIYLH